MQKNEEKAAVFYINFALRHAASSISLALLFCTREQAFVLLREDRDDVISHRPRHDHAPDAEKALAHEEQHEYQHRMHMEEAGRNARVEHIGFNNVDNGNHNEGA